VPIKPESMGVYNPQTGRWEEYDLSKYLDGSFPILVRYNDVEYIAKSAYDKAKRDGEDDKVAAARFRKSYDEIKRQKKLLDEKMDDLGKKRYEALDVMRGIQKMHEPNDDGFCPVCDDILCDTYRLISDHIERLSKDTLSTPDPLEF